MRTDVPFLSRFLSKLLEIVGAGFASAAGAFLLGHIATPAVPPAVVQIVPADAETIRMVRGDQTAVEELRKDLAGADQPAAEVEPAVASVKVEKVAKTANALPARREHRAESARVGMTGQTAVPEWPLQIVPPSNGAGQPAGPQVREGADLPQPLAANQEAGEHHFRLFAALRQIPAWFLPSTDRLQSVAPRPPLPVGQFWQSTM